MGSVSLTLCSFALLPFCWGENLEYNKVWLVAHTAFESSGAINYLYRGNAPIIDDEFAYNELTSYMASRANDSGPSTIPCHTFLFRTIPFCICPSPQAFHSRLPSISSTCHWTIPLMASTLPWNGSFGRRKDPRSNSGLCSIGPSRKHQALRRRMRCHCQMKERRFVTAPISGCSTKSRLE